MILFQCSHCHHPSMVAETLAGHAVTCSYCQQQTSVPAGSDPDVRLIYHAGGSENGTPTMLNDVPALMLGGTLKPTDLVWKGGKWQQLCDVLGEPEHHQDNRNRHAALPPLEDALGPLVPMVFTREDHPLADAASRARRVALKRFRGRLSRVLKLMIAVLVFMLAVLLLMRHIGLLR
jgi:hypothetical protein